MSIFNLDEANKPRETWYRYENYNECIGGFDASGEYVVTGHSVRLSLREIPVHKKTPKGVRLFDGRFCLYNSHKRYACPTKELALESFIQRKKKQMKILSRQLSDAERALQLAEYERQKENQDRHTETERSAEKDG